MKKINYFLKRRCMACIHGRLDGYQFCPAHYSFAKDNRRAIRQTGVGIIRDAQLV